MKNYTTKYFSVVALFAALLVSYGCSPSAPMVQAPFSAPQVATLDEVNPPTPDPRVGLSAGLFDAEEAIWNLETLSQTPPASNFVGITNSDLAFKGNYAIQGNYNGVMIWDISDPTAPVLVKDYVCPASQSDVSVYGDLLFISGEGSSGRIDCGTQGVAEAVSEVRLRGIRIFDITDITEPQYLSNVQTCRGSHTHSVLEDPNDEENVYIYVSGSASVRPEEELAGCNDVSPSEDPNSPLFRIEIIKVPLASPEDAAIVSSPRIFEDLVAPPEHGLAPDDIAEVQEEKAKGAVTYMRNGQERLLTGWRYSDVMEYVLEARGAEEATAADSMYVRENATQIIETMFPSNTGEQRGPDQCHDITIYPEIGLAGGACEGYGLLLDIKDPVNPVRIDAVADSNFSYWHSATFSNDGSKVIFTDEWGGGGQPKCRESDPKEWGANAIFTINDGTLEFVDYYKLPAPQSALENCVAHNGSMIPVPDRDIMVQAWYQGGISIFDWTDPSNPTEIAFHDRGPVSADRLQMGGSWSVYWYNGLIVSSEIARGLDIFDLTPSPFLTENEIAAAKTVQWDYLNAQGHPMFVWPSTPALAKAFVDQLDRDKGLDAASITAVRQGLANADASTSEAKTKIFAQLAEEVDEMASMANDSEKVSKLASTLKDLASM